MQDLNQLLKKLVEGDLDFVIVGGFAAVLHGANHVTKDLDLCLLMTPENIKKLREILKDANPVHRMSPNFKPSFLDYPEKINNLQNIYLETSYGIVDFVSNLQTLGGYDQVEKNSAQVELFGKQIKVISLDDLISVKKSMSRPKDQIILAELEEIKKQSSSD